MGNGNFKVRCVENDREWLTKGKVYEVKDGVFPYDNGCKEAKRFSDFEDFRKYNKNMGTKLKLINESPSITITQKGNKTIAVYTQGGNFIKSAKAICNPMDTYDFKVGADVAIKRLLNIEETQTVGKVLDTYKEVEREPKVGEYIKTTKQSAFKHFEKDEIHKVTQVNNGIAYIDGKKSTEKYEGSSILGKIYVPKWDYVVLEGYQPTIVPKLDLSTISKTDLVAEISRRIGE